MRTRLAVVAVALLVLAVGATALPVSSAGHEAEVRIAAQRLEDGRTEFALQIRGSDGEWGARLLPARRFFPATPALERWLTSSPLTVRTAGAAGDSDGTEVRITAQRLDDGRTEFTLQVRATDGAWGERVRPARRFFPAAPNRNRWFTSSPLTVVVPAPPIDRLPSEGTFRSISVGHEHICGVRTDGAVSCWGSDNSGQTTPPRGSFKAVSAGSNHTCAIGADGTVSCWGAEFAPAPEGTFMSVSAGVNHTCGVKVDGTVACWGDNRQGQAAPPEGSFTSVSAGYSHTCGLRTDGTLTCWGEDVRDQLTAPDGAFGAVSAGFNRTCAVRISGALECWGLQRLPPAGTFADVTIGLNQSCAITATGAITCWGAPGSSAPPGTFAAVSAGFTNVCGLKTDGSVTCWGETFGGQASPPEGAFTTLSAGRSDTCGLSDDGTLVCWGSGYVLRGERIQPPGGSFRDVSAGDMHACAVSTDGSVACWGFDHDGRSTPPEGAFTAVSVGDSHSCGLRADAALACWGSDRLGQAAPPAGTFGSVSSGSLHTCAVGTGGGVACWGLGFSQDRPRWESPNGSFTTVTAGSFHTCGLMTDATVSCWGSNGSGQSTPPRGGFISLGAGAYHTCGVRSDGTVACWGLNLDGQSTPPDGTFTSVSAGDYHTCGIRTDGTTECWGRGSRPTPTPTSTRTPAPTGTPTPTPTPTPSATPGPELPCEDCRADRGAVWVAGTGGDGVAARNDCRDDARTGERGLTEGTPGERVAVGTGRCDGWSYVRSGSWAGWIRDRYLEDTPSGPTLDCTDCDPVESATVWIAHTDGDGVAVRDDCLDSARVERWVYPEGSQLQLAATGTGRCADWSYVHGRDSATWIRNRYLADEEPIIPIAFQIPARLLPELPIPFCTIPPTDDQNASFDDAQLRAAATEAARIWNTALQEAVHDHPLTGPAIDYTGDCPSDTKGALNGRNEIYVVATVPGSWTGQAYSWPRMVEGTVQYETDIAVTDLLRPGCNLEQVMTHEMGHSLGLGHGGSRGDLMYRRSDGRCPHPNTSEIGVLLDAYAP